MQPFYSPFEIVGINIDKKMLAIFSIRNDVPFWNSILLEMPSFTIIRLSPFFGKHLFDFRPHFSHLRSASVANLGHLMGILAFEMLKIDEAKENSINISSKIYFSLQISRVSNTACYCCRCCDQIVEHIFKKLLDGFHLILNNRKDAGGGQ